MILDVEGKRFEVLRFGSSAPDRGRAPIVFLHEGLGSAKHWRDFPARVAAATGREAIAYSRLGYGRSDPVPLPRPLDYMERDAREWVPRILDALGAPRFVLFGHSDGASIALLHTAYESAAGKDRIEKLVLEAPHVFVEDLSIASIQNARESYRTTDLKNRLARHHGDNVEVAFRGWNDAWLDPGFRSWNIESVLPAVGVPLLLIQGEDDAYGTRAQLDAIAQKAQGPSTLALLPGCGHAPHRDAPDVVLDHVRRFLA
jgi:pimeloyl-ACP methyl ester carboxylesterase